MGNDALHKKMKNVESVVVLNIEIYDDMLQYLEFMLMD